MGTRLETTARKQYAVLWAASGYDNDGEETVSAGIEIDVRWVFGEVEGTDKRGTPDSLDATVVVDRVVETGSIMRLGRLSAVPSPPTDLYRVVNYNETPDLKARNYRREVTLRRHKDDLPTITL